MKLSNPPLAVTNDGCNFPRMAFPTRYYLRAGTNNESDEVRHINSVMYMAGLLNRLAIRCSSAGSDMKSARNASIRSYFGIV